MFRPLRSLIGIGLSSLPSHKARSKGPWRGLHTLRPRVERLEERSLLSVVSNEVGWAFNIEAGSEIQVRDTAVDTAGNLYMVGGFYGVCDFDPGDGVAALESVKSINGDYSGDGFLAQYRADGTLGWLRHVAQGPGWDEARGVAVDDEGNVYVTGHFGTSPAQVAGQTLINDSNEPDGFVVKYPVAVVGEEPGEAAWIDQFYSIYPSASRLYAFTVEVDNMGHVFAGGTVDGDEAVFGPFTLPVDTCGDCWVTRLNAETGTVEWAWDSGPSIPSASLPDGQVWNLVVVPPQASGEAGGVFACGRLSQPIYFDNQLVPGPGGFVTRLDWETGDVVWAKNAGYVVYSLDLGGPDNNLYLTGTFESEADFGDYDLISAGLTDIFAAQMDPATGDFVWAASVGGPGIDGYENYRPGIAATADGDVYLTGSFKAIADLDPGPGAAILSGGSSIEGFLARIDPSTNSLARLWHLDPIGDGGSPCTHLELFTNPDGLTNLYVLGAFRGTVEFPVGILIDTTENFSDRFVMRIDPELDTYLPAVTATDDSYAYWEDYTLTVPIFEGVLANDTDANHGSLWATVPSQPANGTVAMNPDGSFTYTPNANFTGVDTFSYEVSDGRGGLDTGTVTIEVKPTAKTTFASTDVPKALVDYGTTTSTVSIADGFLIADVNVQLDITHPRDPDLDVFLVAPDGTRVELFTDVGTTKSANFTNTLLDDQATLLITAGKAPFTGTFRPEGSLAAFNGKSAGGTWTLEISDDQKKQTGTLNSWSLEITPVDPVPDSGASAAAAPISQLDDQSVDRLLASGELDLATLAMLWEDPQPNVKRDKIACGPAAVDMALYEAEWHSWASR